MPPTPRPLAPLEEVDEVPETPPSGQGRPQPQPLGSPRAKWLPLSKVSHCPQQLAAPTLPNHPSSRQPPLPASCSARYGKMRASLCSPRLPQQRCVPSAHPLHRWWQLARASGTMKDQRK